MHNSFLTVTASAMLLVPESQKILFMVHFKCCSVEFSSPQEIHVSFCLVASRTSLVKTSLLAPTHLHIYTTHLQSDLRITSCGNSHHLGTEHNIQTSDCTSRNESVFRQSALLLSKGNEHKPRGSMWAFSRETKSSC